MSRLGDRIRAGSLIVAGSLSHYDRSGQQGGLDRMANLKLVAGAASGGRLQRALQAVTRMLKGDRDPAAAAKRILSELATLTGAQRGVLYVQRGSGDEARLELA